MSFADELNKMAAQEKTKPLDIFDITINKIYQCLKTLCVDKAKLNYKCINGFLYTDPSESGNPIYNSIEVCTELYQKYPYIKEVRYDYNLFNSKKVEEIYKEPIGTKTFCEQAISTLKNLFSKDGFKEFDLKAVPVYVARIERYSNFFGSKHYEKGSLTDISVGYVIEFHIKW